ncbi:MAG TPA: ABC transporter ATP-binding protein [Candidatus Dormibacteraeota bacterium]|nr:ABC transporter ATP-binding protein [Candidatus Dormibacteraeota bacterium]
MTAPPVLELVGVVKRFGQITVADGIGFSVEEGEALGIVGPNGAGKTSLFGVISGELPADAGDILLESVSVKRLDAAARCRLGIGRTFQVPREFQGMTVLENVLVAAHQGGRLRSQQATDFATEVLEETGLLGSANRLAGSLGLLQRKRLELARALATRPKLLLLDEVAGGLTDPEVDELVGVVRRAQGRGISIIWIEHVLRAIIDTVDRLICLAGGRIVGEGAPTEVLGMTEVRELFLGAVPGEVSVASSAGTPPNSDPDIHSFDGGR